jgi:hypothetical protein
MTVIIISQPRSATKTHEFSGTTAGGRAMKISVVAAADILPDAVLADLRGSMPIAVNLDFNKDGIPGFFAAAGTMLLLWGLVLVFGLAVCMFLDAADFVDIRHNVWAEYLPIMGGYAIPLGLLRLWVAAAPAVAVVFSILVVVAFRMDKTPPGSVKVGR